MNNCRNRQSHREKELRSARLSFLRRDAASVKGLVFQLDPGMASLRDWASEISFCVFAAWGSEMESVKSSCALVKL